MVAGFGAGKTQALVVRCLVRKFQYPDQSVAYYLPTYDLARVIAFPRFAEVLESWGVAFNLNRNDNEITFPAMRGRIIFRTMDRPERIVGYEVADSFVDELDTMKTESARDAWNKILGRNRQSKPDGSLNTVAVGTTPEGFRFTYERWQRNPAPGYELIKAPTSSNQANLPADYIDSLKNTYPDNLLSAYLEGEFVNLRSGTVYPEFDRTANATDAAICDGEPLHIGMDFNVANMAAVVHVIRDNQPLAAAEIVGARDTPEMIEIIRQQYGGHSITIYPDQSGGSRKSVNASVSDLSLLKQAGFRVHQTGSNPAVRDRVLALNASISRRNYKVNSDTCPQLMMSLEQQVYTQAGEPDKSNGYDHVNDAAGYFVHAKFPVKRDQARTVKLKGF